MKQKEYRVSVHGGAKRALPCLMSTKTFPAYSLEIRRSSSRYVVSNHDSTLLFDNGILNGGWLEIVCFTVASKPLIGVRSMFCPINSTFSGNTMKSVKLGSSNSAFLELDLRIKKQVPF
ncbi:hypothetical protein V6N13_033309 [Hibiscus sabdariffa]|uniref:Uncharacterized protein n=1 Tax=Hibiscus sabdariffa TaxID=183260 RepID=A0ABR2FAW4_9ROSI